MNRMSPTEIAAWCEEPFLTITDAGAAALFDPTPTVASLATFLDGLQFGSRKGGVYLYVLANQIHPDWNERPNPILAHLARHLWCEGRGGSAIEEFGLTDEWDIYPDDLLDQMWPFRCSPVLMNPDELAAFRGLPERFTVWRGGPRDEVRYGNSWTTDRARAEWFAARRENGCVAWRRPHKADVVAYVCDRGEAEIILFSPGPTPRSPG